MAERYGLVNRALPAAELDGFVDTLARRIAGLRPQVIAVIKATVNTVAPPIPLEAYAVENASLHAVFGEEVLELAHKQLAAGVQTREGERDLEGILNRM